MRKVAVLILLFLLLFQCSGVERNIIASSVHSKNVETIDSENYFVSEAKIPISPLCKSENQNIVNYHITAFTILKPKNVYRFFTPSLSRYYPNYGLKYIERKLVDFKECDLPPPSV